MLHKQAKNHLFVKKVQKYLRAKSALRIMTGGNVPSPVTLTEETLNTSTPIAVFILSSLGDELKKVKVKLVWC